MYCTKRVYCTVLINYVAHHALCDTLATPYKRGPVLSLRPPRWCAEAHFWAAAHYWPVSKQPEHLVAAQSLYLTDRLAIKRYHLCTLHCM